MQQGWVPGPGAVLEMPSPSLAPAPADHAGRPILAQDAEAHPGIDTACLVTAFDKLHRQGTLLPA